MNQGPQFLEGRYTLALPSPSRLAISMASSPAVKTLREWLDAAGIETGPLFRPINKAGTVAVSRLTADPSRISSRRMPNAPGSMPPRFPVTHCGPAS